ncbi:hypothetical protein THAOC_05342 [Thalassiosira oceanica]|uniref:Uncharacterized protein n=1 Tax=Thalassiosira oceanica TaxID=159749 RepID=K0T7G0_THAOC|nr:hypothetical protein THAOC_05342 [Thalassiosira oceanica]|eukprot:EJK73059.1 hypothetical protein THAOC_05342 [Thalassiosira oceanica]
MGAAEQDADYSSRGKGQRRAGHSPPRPGGNGASRRDATIKLPRCGRWRVHQGGKRQEEGQAAGITERRKGLQRREGRTVIDVGGGESPVRTGWIRVRTRRRDARPSDDNGRRTGWTRDVRERDDATREGRGIVGESGPETEDPLVESYSELQSSIGRPPTEAQHESATTFTDRRSSQISAGDVNGRGQAGGALGNRNYRSAVQHNVRTSPVHCRRFRRRDGAAAGGVLAPLGCHVRLAVLTRGVPSTLQALPTIFCASVKAHGGAARYTGISKISETFSSRPRDGPRAAREGTADD